MFLTVKILEDTPAVLSLGKLCEDHGYSDEWTKGQKPCLTKMVFGLISTRRTTFRSWSQACLRLPLHRAHRQLRNHHHRKVKIQHLFQYRLIVGEQMSTNGDTWIETQPKIQKPTKVRITHTNGVTRLIPKYLHGCKNSRKNLADRSVPEPHGARVPVLGNSHASSSH